MTTSEKIHAVLAELGYRQSVNDQDLTEEWRNALRGLKTSQVREIHKEWDGSLITLPSNFTKARRAWEIATGWKPANPSYGSEAAAGDTATDFALSGWLNDVEYLLLKIYSWQGKKETKDYISTLISHNPEKAWQDDPVDKYHEGGAKFNRDGSFVELGPYWEHVRHVGHILAGVGMIRPYKRCPEPPKTKALPVGKAQWAALIASVKAHKPETGYPAPAGPIRPDMPLQGDAWEETPPELKIEDVM
jgi:hypothetical protein